MKESQSGRDGKKHVESQKSSKQLLAKTIPKATYILNRSALTQRTPFEVWHGWKPNVSHF